MDWRLQGVGLIAGTVLAGIPLIFGLQPYSSPSRLAVAPSVFASSWSNLASVMQYPLFASLAFAILGIVWKGSHQTRSVLIQLFSSFGLGCGMLYSLASVQFTTIDSPGLGSATLSAQNLLACGLIVPTLGFFSSLTWLLLERRRRLAMLPSLSQQSFSAASDIPDQVTDIE